MPKKTLRPKRRGGYGDTNRVPTFLLPTSSSGSVAAPTLDGGLPQPGLPKTPGREDDVQPFSSSSDGPQTPQVKAQISSADNSSPPHDAAAVLSALAGRNSPQPPSPGPASLTHSIASPSVKQVIIASSPTQPKHHELPPHDDSASSIHSNASPAVIRRSSGRGFSFMPSSQSFNDLDQGTGFSTAIAQAERPSWGRRASGAARELFGLGQKKNRAKLKKGRSQPDIRTIFAPRPDLPKDEDIEDPTVAQQVDKMMEDGHFEVGAEYHTPHGQDLVLMTDETGDASSQNPQERSALEDLAALLKKGASKVSAQKHDQELPKQSEKGAKASSERDRDFSGHKDQGSSLADGTGGEAHHDEREAEDIPIEVGLSSTTSKQKKRGLPDTSSACVSPRPQDSDEERTLNEVNEVDERRSRQSSEERERPTRMAASDVNKVYIPPYKPRKEYEPVPLTQSSDEANIAWALSTTVTRHSTLPFESSRRIEVRVAWNEPKTLVWLPGRSYIPDWTIEYVTNVQRGPPGLVRRVVKGMLGMVPFVGRLANWI